MPRTLFAPPRVPTASPRVLFVATSTGAGGMERHSAMLADILQRSGLSVAYACQPMSFLEAICVGRGVPVLPLRVRNSGDLRAVLRLIGLIRSFRADIVHVHSRRDMVAAVLATAFLRSSGRMVGRGSASPRLVLHAHLDKGLGQPPFGNGLILGQAAQAVVAVSQAVRQTLRRVDRLPDDLIRVIRCGVDMAQFFAPATSRAQAWRRIWRAKWNIPDHALVVGMVGRLSDKGQEALLALAPSLVQQHPSLRLVFIGPEGHGGARQRLEAAARSLDLENRAVFTGQIEDMPAALAALDVLAHFPLSEAFGLVPLEAMASGLPVVASAVGGCLEVVEDGVTGLLVSPSDAQARRAALSFLLDSGEGAGCRLAMGQAGQVRAASLFSLNHETIALRSLYDELMRA